ncbi:probable F-actin-capping protein subunit beta isoform X2 [Amborella trichopoda]|uniref:probable F-actin-capping protein subunit beta isoform X2 n=1 Tax=Amborella trichopoda TaxID=13333 RepID=UPI0009BE8FEE|nr:probable F-actin-capping protein subunit beta isoform X2 [Amborella trichopoda]|eukprot:XP_020519210.1 probable F-actin-capping protein subunit beta isoform X2 [Amborella trichopoda]
MEAAMDLMRRMPPKQSQTALSSLLALLPEHSQELLSRVDQPLEVLCDVESGKEFLLCDYNRDGDSHRSPWSNKYHPPLDDGCQPSADLRKLEVEANDVFAVYRDQYYEGGISSVYMWEPDEGEGFASCFLIKKDGSKSGQGRRGYLQEGLWDAIHVIEVGAEDEGTARYRLTSTVMLSLTTSDTDAGTFNLSGSITRQMILDLAVSEGHLCNMGRMIEEMEGKLRNSLDQTKEMVFSLRRPPDMMQQQQDNLLVNYSH